MQAWLCNDVRPIPALVQENVVEPTPVAGEVLLRVHAAGITPSELLWYPTTHTKSGEDRQRAIVGHEFSGVVTGVGEGAAFVIGDEVFGMNDWFAEGATAEYCCAPQSAIATKPKNLPHSEAASMPIAALTAWQGLFDRADLQAGQRVLIHGGAGAVGVIALQLARWRGAEIVTTASHRNEDLLLRLGAKQVIDYRTQKFEKVVKDVDVVFDTVGGETLERSWQVLSREGKMVTVAASGESTTDQRAQEAFFIVEPNQQQLMEVARLMELGQLQPVIDAIVTFDEADLAYSRKFQPRRGYGKMVVSMD